MEKIKQHVPTILSALSVVGVVTTSVLASKATIKAYDEVEELRSDGVSTKDKIVMATPYYIPAIISGVATVGCVMGANMLNKRQQVSLASAYALLSEYHRRYRNKLIELYGREADEEILDDFI